MKQISDMGDLAILTLLAHLADWNKKNLKRTYNLADLDLNVFPFSWAKSELAISVFRPLNFLLAVPNYGNLWALTSVADPNDFCSDPDTTKRFGSGSGSLIKKEINIEK